ncbi:LysE family transporter [Marinomonas sp.]|nr:LysE family transporter [Marinomonas sp.]MDB4838068.1 LysE family transporter [Marinomonas sp.]
MLYIDYLELYSVAIITLLAVISPGPDFAMVSKVALLKGRRDGILCALGIGAAISVHLTYTLLGLGIIFADNVWILNSLRYLGALYLIWLGLSALWPDIKNLLIRSSSTTQPKDTQENKKIGADINVENVNNATSFWMGFACNALNPKTMLFIVALFSQVISNSTPWEMEIGYGLYIALAHFVWFALVASLLTADRVQKQVSLLKHWIERVTGVFLAVFGIKLLVS